MPIDEYLEQVGSLNPNKVDDTSFKDVQNFVKGEVDYHQKCLDDACDEKLKVPILLFYLRLIMYRVPFKKHGILPLLDKMGTIRLLI